jgi:hypothetical protein
MYGLTADKDVRFNKSERSIDRAGENSYRLIVHTTNNKDNELEVCSVSVFDRNSFVAYLFSTNDPLAFDNFNCYRGGADNASRPAYNSVEQLVFCENKVQINLALVRNMDKSDFYTAAMNNPHFGYDHFIKVLQRGGVDLEPSMQLFEDTLGSEISSADKSAGLKAYLHTLLVKEADYLEKFYKSYLVYCEDKLSQRHDLPPFKHYKLVGRGICAVGDFLDIFDRCSLMCTISARMKQLCLSKSEQSLVAALVPRCVAECSKDDGLWGYIIDPVNKDKRLTWLAGSDGDARLLEIISDATVFQDAYLTHLSGLLNDSGQLEAAENFLFSSDEDIKTFRKRVSGLSKVEADKRTHRLGLSERLLQSLWTKQIVFSKELIDRITLRLAQYGITYVHYVPELSVSEGKLNALAIARSIGRPA